MSDRLIWRDAWELGIALLDEEHRVMVRLLNALLEDADPRPLTERLDALIAHLRRHFHTEEVFLRAIDYPGADTHCREHLMQLAEFVDLRRGLARSGAAVLEADDRRAMLDWFFNHVIAEDQRFGVYYREQVCGGGSRSAVAESGPGGQSARDADQRA